MPTPHIILFQNDWEGGDHVHIAEAVPNLTRVKFDNETSSVIVLEGEWELFGSENYTPSAHTPATVTLTPTGGRGGTGVYHTTDLATKGLANDDLSSLRPK